MKRSTIVIGIVMAILCIPAAQTVASAFGIAGPAPVDVAAKVYANVSDSACGYGSDYNPDDWSYSSVYVCAVNDHARLDWETSSDSAQPPANRSGAKLVIYTFGCRQVEVQGDNGSYFSYQCDGDSYRGEIPADALVVDPLLGTGSIRASVLSDRGRQCEIDLAFDTPDGPRAGNDQWSRADPSHSLSVSVESAIGASATSGGSMTGSVCGDVVGSSTFGQLSRGAGLRVNISVTEASAAP